MRSDFGRIVIERERHNSSEPGLKAKRVGKIDTSSLNWEDWEFDGNTRIPNSARKMKAIDNKLIKKDFSDVLRPIYGYLHKNIGRSWDSIYSELMQHLGSGDHPTAHVLYSHVLSEVDIDTYWENGKIHTQPYKRAYGKYYVHPLTGVLCVEPDNPRRKRQPKEHEINRIYNPATDKWFVCIDVSKPTRTPNKIWFIGKYQRLEPIYEYQPYSSWMKRTGMQKVRQWWRTSQWPDIRIGEDEFEFLRIKQASSKELKVLRHLLSKTA